MADEAKAFPEWLYHGVHRDPHYRSHVSGMTALADSPVTDDIVARCVPPDVVPPFEVRTTTDLPGGATAYAFREAWKTHIDPQPVYSLFVTTQKHETFADAMAAAAQAFPDVWSRFNKLTAGETCTFAPKLSEASPSSTSETESTSKPGKASAKSSA